MDATEREKAESELREAIKAAHNERTKLTATYLNGLAIALVAVGGFSPLFAPRITVSSGPAETLQSAAGLGLCIAISGALHLIGRLVLGRLR